MSLGAGHPHRALLALALLQLAGCGGYFGADEAPPLPGERVPVLLINQDVDADPTIADLAVVLPTPVANPDWPQAMREADHDPGHVALADDVALAWRASIGAGNGGGRRILSPPVVGAGAGAVYAMDAKGAVSAHATADGTRLWRVVPEGLEGDDRLRAGGVALGRDRVFATTGTGLVLAFDAGDGREVWRRPLLAPIRTAPAVADGRVLVTTTANQTFALDAAGGEVIWQYAGFPEQASILGGAVPAAAGNAVIAAYSSGDVVGLDAEGGQVAWQDTVLRPRRTLAINTIGGITGAPVIAGDRVIVAGNGGETAAIRLADGERLWDVEVASAGTPWVAGAYVYVLSDRNELVAILRDNGRVRWISPLQRLSDPDDPNSRRVYWTGPVLAGDRLLLASSEGGAVGVSPYTGEILDRIDLPYAVSVPPVVADRTLYILTDDGELVAYR